MQTPTGEGDDRLKILRQARGRAARLAEDLERYRLGLQEPCRSVPRPVLDEGEAALRRAADAAARVLGRIDSILAGEGGEAGRAHAPPSGNSNDQGCS